jgi:2-desacetyl-2-hydroxyethyl bacteriochlorophyllide A dehydrogenase
MKALVFTGPGAVELRDVPEPEPADGEVVVHVRSAGICGSELHGVRHPGFRVPPLIMGHEFAGVSDFGDPVIVNPVLSCGQCGLCRNGRRQLCRRRALLGVHRSGGFAERVAVPKRALRPLPETLTWDGGALVEPAANAVHAWRLSGASEGADVAVLGCGAIGLLCLLIALAEGAASVTVTDLSPDRLALAKTLGATATGLQEEGEYDAIFDAVGSAATREQSMRHQRPGGVSVWLGLAEPAASFDGNALVREEKRITGSFAYTDAEFDRAAELVRAWDLSWVTGYPLGDGAEIFTSLMNGASRPVKAMLRPVDSEATTGQSTPS